MIRIQCINTYGRILVITDRFLASKSTQIRGGKRCFQISSKLVKKTCENGKNSGAASSLGDAAPTIICAWPNRRTSREDISTVDSKNHVPWDFSKTFLVTFESASAPFCDSDYFDLSIKIWRPDRSWAPIESKNETIEDYNPLIRDTDCSIRGPCMPANELYLHTEVAQTQ